MGRFMYFWLSYSDGNNHIDRIPVAVKNLDHLFVWLVKQLSLINFICFYFLTVYLFLLSDSTRIDDNEYLDDENLEIATELIVCTEEQIEKLSIYFELKDI